MCTCVFLLHEAIITECIFDLQALSDLMMCILFHNDHQEYELEYKEKIHLILLLVMYGLCIFDVHF